MEALLRGAARGREDDVPLPGGEDAVGGAGGAAAAEVTRAEGGTKIVISLHVVGGDVPPMFRLLSFQC